MGRERETRPQIPQSRDARGHDPGTGNCGGPSPHAPDKLRETIGARGGLPIIAVPKPRVALPKPSHPGRGSLSPCAASRLQNPGTPIFIPRRNQRPHSRPAAPHPALARPLANLPAVPHHSPDHFSRGQDMTQQIAILGASGYTGAELVRLLATHPSMRIAALSADRKAGLTMDQVFPFLRHLDLPTAPEDRRDRLFADRPLLLRPATCHHASRRGRPAA